VTFKLLSLNINSGIKSETYIIGWE